MSLRLSAFVTDDGGNVDNVLVLDFSRLLGHRFGRIATLQILDGILSLTKGQLEAGSRLVWLMVPSGL